MGEEVMGVEVRVDEAEVVMGVEVRVDGWLWVGF